MPRVRITMDNAALRDVATGAATREPGFDVRAVQVVRRVGASHGGRPVDEVYETLRASLLQIPGVQKFDEAQIRGCATRISQWQDPLPKS
ncbi:hypothetical protein [Streptosporangium carneum]|uniref:Uncharacterized protein n=1 Tax=Streptosporangium carneum TaxID=47481 RepID=A0A9W6IBK8_9ACTN|nr:hypothetical protein [Streptosporangium carneum]GLK14584.1 hypothetical protein GCM10017600_79960 [Streptosporangium carneum]